MTEEIYEREAKAFASSPVLTSLTAFMSQIS